MPVRVLRILVPMFTSTLPTLFGHRLSAVRALHTHQMSNSNRYRSFHLQMGHSDASR